MISMRMGLRLLETLTSALYEDPIVLFREYVQNSVDAYVEVNRDTCVMLNDDFFVDIHVDKDNKNITIRDNGYGIDIEEFQSVMQRIGSSKKHNLDQIGFRGIGRLSAMPFCKTLKFKNKVKEKNIIQIFEWDGNEYHKLLASEEDQELQAAIQQITNYHDETFAESIDDHFFEVEIIEYREEIQELLSSTDFEFRLSTMLPLKYAPNFSAQEAIKSRYEEFLNMSLDNCAFNVRFEERLLYKPYNNANILESDIQFWDLQFKQTDPNIPAEKLGVLWFTFDRRVSSAGKTGPLGIYVRSKNMLVGGAFSLADAVTKSNTDYVSTYREIAQTLKGVYGEMLLYSPKLDDNARRDWFKIDNASIELRGIIADFLRRLIAYRYAASKAFNNKNNAKTKEVLIKTYNELTQGSPKDDYVTEFYNESSKDASEDKIFEYADDDIPRFAVTYKKFYDQIMRIVRSYYIEQDGLNEFIKLRTHLKKSLNEEDKN